jgi:predicted dehydrogenase
VVTSVRWGVLGTGSIARTMVAANPGAIVAVASRDAAKAASFGLTGAAADPYRIEIAAVSAAIAGRQPLEFGRDDAIAQATAYEALQRAATTGAPVDL